MFLFKNYFLFIYLFFLIISCSTIDSTLEYIGVKEEEEKLGGKRLDIIRLGGDLEVDENAKKQSLYLTDKIINYSWNQIGNLSTHVAGNYLINEDPKFNWERRIGDGEGTYNKIYSQPVGNEKALFALDAEGILAAINMDDGKIIWKTNVFPESESLNSNIDGGLALQNNNLIVSTSYGDIINVNTEDGKIRWRINNNKPAQGSPSVYQDYLFQMTIHNELFVYNINTGEEVWRYISSFVSAISNGGTSAAINNKVVIFPSNTGELIALDLKTGSLIWSSNLVVEGSLSGSLELTDIDSGPVIHNDLIFAASLSGVFVAVDTISGAVVWDILIKTSNSPVVNGNAVFILSDDGKIINVLRNSGKIRWILNIAEKVHHQEESKAICKGPLLASDHLWIVCQNEKVFKINAFDGIIINSFDLDSSSHISPIVIKDNLIFYTEDAEVIVYR